MATSVECNVQSTFDAVSEFVKGSFGGVHDGHEPSGSKRYVVSSVLLHLFYIVVP